MERINPTMTISKKYLIIVVVLCGILVLTGGTLAAFKISGQAKQIAWLKRDIENKDKQIKEKEGEAARLAQEKGSALVRGNRLEDEKKTLETKMAVAKDAVMTMAEAYDDMDALILSDDKRNRADIEWYTDNGRFDVESGTLVAARYRYSSWLEYMKKSDAEYTRISTDVRSSINDLGELMRYIETLSGDQTQVH